MKGNQSSTPSDQRDHCCHCKFTQAALGAGGRRAPRSTALARPASRWGGSTQRRPQNVTSTTATLREPFSSRPQHIPKLVEERSPGERAVTAALLCPWSSKEFLWLNPLACSLPPEGPERFGSILGYTNLAIFTPDFVRGT